jgi:hypothetical protein
MQLYIDNLNAEKRLLEDTMYELQYDYETKVAEVEELKAELEELKAGGPRTPDRSVKTPRTFQPERAEEAVRDLFPGVPEPEPPKIEEGTPQAPSSPTLPPANPELDDLEPPKIDLGEDASPLSAIPMPDDQAVASLYLHPADTGGWQQDREPGDDGVVVVFEPRNGEQAFVPRSARVSAVLLDPETRQRVARWEFTEDEVAMALQKARPGRGIELKMPWQETPPGQSRLHLFVRYWLPDGGTVEADREIAITPQGQLAARWTPRTQPRSEQPARRPVTPVADEKSWGDRGAAPATAAGQDEAVQQAQRPEWRPYR